MFPFHWEYCYALPNDWVAIVFRKVLFTEPDVQRSQ